MMNGVALLLVIFSLAGAGVWSPAPAKISAVAGDHHHGDGGGGENAFREGHRMIIVEYEREFPDKRRRHPPPLESLSAAVEEAKEKLAEAVSVMPNLGQGISSPLAQEKTQKQETRFSSTKEMICDAYGVCKEKISGLIGKSKEKAAKLEEGVKHAEEEVAEKAKDTISELIGKSKEKAAKLEERVKHAEEEVAEKAKDTISELIGKSKEKAAKLEERVKHAEEEVAEKAKEIRNNVTEKAKQVKHDVTEMLRRVMDVVYEAVAAPETSQGAAAVAHLLGFATAYGTCLWVSFISSQVLAAALSRHQFGILQSKLYPVYFRAMAYSVGLAALIAPERSLRWPLLFSLPLVLLNLFLLEPKATKVRVFIIILIIIVILVIYIIFYVLQVMFEKMKLEKEEGRGRDITDVETETTTSTRRTATATPTTTTVGVTKTTVTQETFTEKEDLKNRIEKLNARLRALNSYSSFVNVLSLMALSWHLVNLSRRLQGSCEHAGAR